MKLEGRRLGRLAAGVLAVSLALSASPLTGLQSAAAADALPPLADPLADGAFCDGAPATNPFSDLGAETTATRATILCLVATQVTTGTSSTTYSPGGTVTRRQMALFIKRLADLANDLEVSGLTDLPTYDGVPDYTDIDGESAATKEAIGQLSQAGIVQGTTSTHYSPGARVSRRQMAAFVNRLEAFLTGTAFSTTNDYFDDDAGDSGEDNLNAVASVGIFQGDGAGNVFPGASLTRRQMANILLRHAQVMLDDGDVTRPFSNQSYSVTPTDAATLTWIDNPESPTKTSDDRQYTVSGLTNGTTYKIALLPAANVKTSVGSLAFVDVDGNNQADGVGVVGADILVVNGTASSSAVASAQPINGSISFTVDGDNAEETVAPVVWLDHGPHVNQLDLTVPGTANSLPKEPSEAFGVGGPVTYVPAEAVAGTHTSADVVNVYPAANSFTAQTDVEHAGSTETFYYDPDDVFQYQGGGITLSQFESMLSPTDTLTVTYEPDPSNISTFNVTADAAPTAPGVTSVAVKNLDGNATANDVQVTFTPPANNASGVTYALQRADTAPNGTCGGGDDPAPASGFLSVSATIQTNADGSRTFTHSNVANGCYDFRVSAANPVSGSSAQGVSWVASTGSGVPVTGGEAVAPTSTSLSQTNGSDSVSGSLDRGDVITIQFSEQMATPNSSVSPRDKIRFTDGDGTVVDVECGLNATCSLNGAPLLLVPAEGTVLTLTLTADPTPVSPGTVSDMAIASGVVTSQVGITDVANNNWDIAGSSDTSLA